MTLDALIMFAGAFVALLPFLGIPNSWDRALYFLVGVFVFALGVLVRRRVPQKPKKVSTYTESIPHPTDLHDEKN